MFRKIIETPFVLLFSWYDRDVRKDGIQLSNPLSSPFDVSSPVTNDLLEGGFLYFRSYICENEVVAVIWVSKKEEVKRTREGLIKIIVMVWLEMTKYRYLVLHKKNTK